MSTASRTCCLTVVFVSLFLFVPFYYLSSVDIDHFNLFTAFWTFDRCHFLHPKNRKKRSISYRGSLIPSIILSIKVKRSSCRQVSRFFISASSSSTNLSGKTYLGILHPRMHCSVYATLPLFLTVRITPSAACVRLLKLRACKTMNLGVALASMWQNVKRLLFSVEQAIPLLSLASRQSPLKESPTITLKH